ncbi:MAG: hypothetical protein EAZ53_11430 [Bacteroidetes bacterium]|nr:MAG: hypothetical protein EAZ53_11430 [Bacteroidota bacterium]
MKSTILLLLTSLILLSCSGKKDYTCTCNITGNGTISAVFTQLTELEIKTQCDDFYKGNPKATSTCKSEVK